MRYWTLTLAAVLAVLFFALQVHPLEPTEIRFLDSQIRTSVSSYAKLSFFLGFASGVLATIAANSFLAPKRTSHTSLAGDAPRA